MKRYQFKPIRCCHMQLFCCCASRISVQARFSSGAVHGWGRTYRCHRDWLHVSLCPHIPNVRQTPQSFARAHAELASMSQNHSQVLRRTAIDVNSDDMSLNKDEKGWGAQLKWLELGFLTSLLVGNERVS